MTNILAAETPDNYKVTWAEWRRLWKIEKRVDAPTADVLIVTPYLYVHFLWCSTRKDFKAWPTTLDTGIAVGWRWPFQRRFREKSWLRHDPLPLALYGAMDTAYVMRAVRELGWIDEKTQAVAIAGLDRAKYIGATIREINQAKPEHGHNLWIANCPDCARRALNLAVRLMTEYKPKAIPDPLNRDPAAAFRLRQQEAEKRLGTAVRSVPSLEDGAK